MYLRQKEHNPPHIHAIYGDCVGMFSLQNGEMFEGDLPIRAQEKVARFIRHYRERLLLMWETQEFEVLPPVE